MGKNLTPSKMPLILAPAGNKASFLAAIAAGADAVYCGLKLFSARMEADNFSFHELAQLVPFAHSKGVKVYVTLNALLKPDELDKAGRLLDRLNRFIKPDALIIQDPAFVILARQAGFKGELHLSTLANVSFPAALAWTQEKTGVSQVVLPRELHIDEIKAMADACPASMRLEVFVHGALCYGVSGRCYWSSFLGGKSGLRGRCVQPCRRLYDQKGQPQRYFSCKDLSLDVLAKVLLSIPQISTWKIEGRKKGPHYVFYTVRAYQMLRDQGTDPAAKKSALAYLEQALGREGTHYNFLPQRPQNPVDIQSQTGSGLFVGKVQGSKQNPYLVPRIDLLAGDLLRLGYEDEPGHGIRRVGKSVPKRGRLHLQPPSKTEVARRLPAPGSPVFLIDRREKYLDELLKGLEAELAKIPVSKMTPSKFKAAVPKRAPGKQAVLEMVVSRRPERRKGAGSTSGLWLSEEALRFVSKGAVQHGWWWLPPVIWPDDENRIRSLVTKILRQGGRNFVLNAPWPMAFFNHLKGLNIWAGPFCNIANGLALQMLKSMGFAGAIVSPELGRDDYFNLLKQSPLPLGAVISGNWPLTISRTLSENVRIGQMLTSPKGEQLWVSRYGPDYWIYPNWKLDLLPKKESLQKAGYSMFVHLNEPLPRQVKLKSRPGLWNWELRLL